MSVFIMLLGLSTTPPTPSIQAQLDVASNEAVVVGQVAYSLQPDEYWMQWVGGPLDRFHIYCRPITSKSGTGNALPAKLTISHDALLEEKARHAYSPVAGNLAKGQLHVFSGDALSTETVMDAIVPRQGDPDVIAEMIIGLSQFHMSREDFESPLGDWFSLVGEGVFELRLVYNQYPDRFGNDLLHFQQFRSAPMFVYRASDGTLSVVEQPEGYVPPPPPATSVSFESVLGPSGDEGRLVFKVQRLPYDWRYPTFQLFWGPEDILTLDCRPEDATIPAPIPTTLASRAVNGVADRRQRQFSASLSRSDSPDAHALIFCTDEITTDSTLSWLFPVPQMRGPRQFFEHPERVHFVDTALRLEVDPSDWYVPQAAGRYRLTATFLHQSGRNWWVQDEVTESPSNSILMDWSREGGWKPVTNARGSEPAR